MKPADRLSAERYMVAQRMRYLDSQEATSWFLCYGKGSQELWVDEMPRADHFDIQEAIRECCQRGPGHYIVGMDGTAQAVLHQGLLSGGGIPIDQMVGNCDKLIKRVPAAPAIAGVEKPAGVEAAGGGDEAAARV